MGAHSILDGGSTTPDGWAGLYRLTDDQAAQLRRAPPHIDETVTLDIQDEALLAALSRDGRASCAELATATGWSESTVKRRMEHLRATGVLAHEVDVPVEALGFHAEEGSG
jgi:hypothetical protein